MNLTNLDIYTSRLLSAVCLFLILAQANVWLTPINNTILVLGYRLAILLTPLLFLFFNQKLTFVAFVLMEIGLLFWLSHQMTAGTICFAIGVAISGYMLKYYSVFSTQGAASNKIAINIGSVIAGGLVIMSQNFFVETIFCIIMTTIACLSFYTYYRRANLKNFTSAPSHFRLDGFFTYQGIAWSLIGFVIGVKLIAIVSILPQLLLNYHHELPPWFGSMLMLNSLIVVGLQIPIMNKIKHLNKLMAVIPLLFGMLVIICSNFFCISTPLGAFLLTFLLSLVECTISYLDKLSQDDGLLLLKEASVGLGSAATVACVRFLDPQSGAVIIGSISVILLLCGLYLMSASFVRRPIKVSV